MKKVLVVLLAAVLTAGTIMTPFASEEQGHAEVWIEDWRKNTFRDDKKPTDSPKSVNLTVAKNDIEPFQLNVRSDMDGMISCVAFSNLVCGDSVIPVDRISYSYVDYIRSGTNSRYSDDTDPDALADEEGTKWVHISNPIRKTSVKNMAAFPEILDPSQSKKVRAGHTQPIWIRIQIPADTPAGMYLGVLQVRTSFGNFDFDINMDVKNVTIPDTASMDAFSTDIWSQLVGNFDTGVDVIEAAYGVKVDSPEWWRVMESFAKVMKENRINIMTINQTELLLHGPGTKVDASGNVTFDWSFFNKFVTFFKENAGIQQFSCGPLAKYKTNPLNYSNDKPGQEVNDYTQAYIECLTQNPSDGSTRKSLAAADIDAYGRGEKQTSFEYIRQYSSALYDNLKKQGWLEIWTHHIIDEPGKRQQAALYPVMEKILSDGCPGIRTGDAFTVWTAEEQAPHTEVFAVMEYSVDELPEKMQACLKPEDSFWIYTSSVPIKDNYLNRAIDQPVWFMEMLGWFCYKQGATGYLHWGLNQWNTWTKDYLPYPEYPQEVMWENVMGDGSCVYPDKENYSLRSSIRVEAIREASELMSLLWIAEEKHPQEVKRLLDSMLRSGKDYETEIGKISAAREKLLMLAED